MANIQRYKLGSGATRYRAFYHDAAGRKVGRVFRVKRDAEAFLESKGVERHQGTLADTRAERVTLASLWEDVHYHRSKDDEYAANTLAIHEQVWRYLEPTLGGKSLSDLTPGLIDATLNGIERAGMRAKARSVLSSVLGQSTLAVNPAKARRRSTTRAARKAATESRSEERQRQLDADQLDRLLHAVPERNYALVLLCARIGLRPGEALALRVKHLNFLKGRLLVETSLTGATKTGESRTIVLPPVLVEVLAQHVERFSSPDPEALVFPNSDGGAYTLDGWRTVFQRASERAGVNHGLSPNDLRHTAAAFAIHHGANVYDVQRMLGHAKPSITLDTYGYLWDGGQERLAQALDEAMRAEIRA